MNHLVAVHTYLLAGSAEYLNSRLMDVTSMSFIGLLM